MFLLHTQQHRVLETARGLLFNSREHLKNDLVQGKTWTFLLECVWGVGREGDLPLGAHTPASHPWASGQSCEG